MIMSTTEDDRLHLLSIHCVFFSQTVSFHVFFLLLDIVDSQARSATHVLVP